MLKKALLTIIAVLVITTSLTAQTNPESPAYVGDFGSITITPQHSEINPGAESFIRLSFDLNQSWYFYADGPMAISIRTGDTGNVTFARPILPQATAYTDPVIDQQVNVYKEDFSVYVPITAGQGQQPINTDIKITVIGGACNGQVCIMVNTADAITTTLRIDPNADMTNPAFDSPDPAGTKETAGPAFGFWAAIALALIAGITLNIMPCVWPILPIIVMRIVDNAHHKHGKSFTLGLAFSLGIMLFFAAIAALNIILRLFYGTVLQWGDQFRSPTFVLVMALLMVVLGLFMFGLFNFYLPVSMSGKSSAKKGFTGSVAMGFLAALLSTPCSFAILAAAFAWAQAQPLTTATIVIMTIGLGMALPFIILTSMPKYLARLPKPGNWMEIFKKSIGFILLGIALKLFSVLPDNMRFDALYFALVLAFASWMAGTWVSFNSPAKRKWLVRGIAAVLVIIAGLLFLSPPKPQLIDWQSYDAQRIESALKSDQPVLIKFTADWCLSCQVADALVYSQPEVADLITEKNILTILADTTTADMPATAALETIYNEPGVPVSILLLPNGTDHRWRGTSFADELKTELSKIETPAHAAEAN